MRPIPLEPSVVLTLGRDLCERCAEMGGETPCESSLWGHSWISWRATYDPCQGCADLGGLDANLVSGAVGGAPSGARPV